MTKVFVIIRSMKPTTLAAALLLASSFASLTRAQVTPASPPAPASEPTWQNQGESDIGLAANAETDPVKRLDLLKKWEQQYPTSALSNQRTFMTTKTLTALITAAFGKPDGAELQAGTKAAQQLIRGIGDYFNDSLRSLPQLAQVSAAEWEKLRATSEMQAHALLASAAIVRKDGATAEAEYRHVLAIDPSQAATSYQLGALLIHEMVGSKDFTRFPEALYELARSLAVTGPNALPPAGNEAAMKALKTYYTNYHGDTSGMTDLITEAGGAASPPNNFQLLSAQQIANQKQQEHDAWAHAHPDLNIWETIKDTLDQKGDDYFSASLKGVGLPPTADYKGPDMFAGKVVSLPSPKQILVDLDNPAGDAILKFDENLKGDVPPGTMLHFKGVIDAYTKTPSYVLTLEILDPKTDITGLPDGVTFVPEKAAPRSRK
jgi:hypothetical protein